MYMVKTEQVVAVLKQAGFSASIQRKDSRREGFRVRQVNANTVGVICDHSADPLHFSNQLEVALVAQFEVSRPYPDQTILAVKESE